VDISMPISTKRQFANKELVLLCYKYNCFYGLHPEMR